MPPTSELHVDVAGVPIDATLTVLFDDGQSINIDITNMPIGNVTTFLAGVTAGLRSLDIAGPSTPSELELEPEPEADNDAAAPAAPAALTVLGEARGFVCEVAECGKVSASLNGLAIHRSRAHGESARPLHTKTSTPALADDDKLLLRCTDCDFTCGVTNFARLRSHAGNEHGRTPTPVEKTPRVATDADEVAS